MRHAKLVQPIKSRACEDAEYFKVDSTYSKYDMVTSSHMSTDIHDSNVLCYSICVVYITRFVLNGYESKHISDVCVCIYMHIYSIYVHYSYVYAYLSITGLTFPAGFRRSGRLVGGFSGPDCPLRHTISSLILFRTGFCNLHPSIRVARIGSFHYGVEACPHFLNFRQTLRRGFLDMY